jgi:hypothetical protein
MAVAFTAFAFDHNVENGDHVIIKLGLYRVQAASIASKYSKVRHELSAEPIPSGFRSAINVQVMARTKSCPPPGEGEGEPPLQTGEIPPPKLRGEEKEKKGKSCILSVDDAVFPATMVVSVLGLNTA